MDPRQRWEALQVHLTAARTACDAGDREKALEYVDGALALDPSFLAAHCLRERVMSPPESAAPALTTDVEPSVPVPSTPVIDAAPRSPLMAEVYGRFEHRARQRRIDRRIAAARAAIERRQPEDAAAALDEVIELDPNSPDLSELTAELDELRRAAASRHLGRWIVAAAVFVIGVVGLWSQDPESLLSHATVGVPQLAVPSRPVATVMVPAAVPVATTGEPELPVEAPPPEPVTDRLSRGESVERVKNREEPTGQGISAPVERRISRAEPIVVNEPLAIVSTRPAGRLPVRDAPVEAAIAVAAPVALAVAPPVAASLAVAALPLQRPPVLPQPLQERPGATAAASPVVPAATSLPAVDDELLIEQTLQHYRHAYERLDAQSAQVVYPAVDQAALARAFDGLHSQSLAFDACAMHVRGGSATATCHGSARYVPKIGSREPHTEPRVWSFTLRKTDGDWTIENARAER